MGLHSWRYRHELGTIVKFCRHCGRGTRFYQGQQAYRDALDKLEKRRGTRLAGK